MKKNQFITFFIFLSAFLFGICPGLLSAQTTEPNPKPQITKEIIEERMKAVQENGGLDETAKDKLLETYKQALDALKIAGEWKTKGEEFDTLRITAPERLKTIKDDLTKPVEEIKVQFPEGATLGELEQLLSQKDADVITAKDAADKLEEEQKNRSNRRLENPKLIKAARDRMTETMRALRENPPDETPEQKIARQSYLNAKRLAIDNEMECYQKEILSYDARGDLLVARKDLVTRTVSQAEKAAAAWRDLVSAKRKEEADRKALEAEESRKAAARAHPALQDIAEENSALTKLRQGPDGLAEKIKIGQENLVQIRKKVESIRESFRGARNKVRAAGLTNAVGFLLRKEKTRLPNLGRTSRDGKIRQELISNIQLEIIIREDQRSALADIDPAVEEVATRLAPTIVAEQKDLILQMARELMNTRKTYLDDLIKDYNSYFTTLVDLDAEEKRLVDVTRGFSNYINQHILWIRSGEPLDKLNGKDIWDAANWMIGAENWSDLSLLLQEETRRRPYQSSLLFCLIALLFLLHQRVAKLLMKNGESLGQKNGDQASHTVSALIYTVLLALPWPALLWCLSWFIAGSLDATEFPRAIAAGLQACAWFWFPIAFLRAACRPQGLGEAHFLWSVASIRAARIRLFGLLILATPLLFTITCMEAQENPAWSDSLGRASFLVGGAVLAYFIIVLLRPSGAVITPAIAKDPESWLAKGRYLIFLFCMATPLALSVIAAMGYYFTAIQLSLKLEQTLLLILGLGLLHALALRGMRIAKAKGLGSGPAPEEKKTVSLLSFRKAGGAKLQNQPQELDLQTRQTMRMLFSIALLLGIWGVWAEVIPALNALDQIKLWTHQTEVTEIIVDSAGVEQTKVMEKVAAITLKDLLFAIAILSMTALAAKNIPALAEILIIDRLRIDAGARFAIHAIMSYIIMLAGLVAAFWMLGFTWNRVQWLAAAMTVGLGFGLQEIFANFVSGLIILFERPIRVGDIVTVGNIEGRVTRIQIRATTIQDWDRRELIVPNRDFVTGSLINWTLSDTITRLTIPVGVAYGSDVPKVKETLLSVANECRFVLKNPEPVVIFRSFGNSTLDFQLRVHIASRDVWQESITELHEGIDREFRAKGIEIAFPQIDLHLKTVEAVKLDPGLKKENL